MFPCKHMPWDIWTTPPLPSGAAFQCFTGVLAPTPLKEIESHIRTKLRLGTFYMHGMNACMVRELLIVSKPSPHEYTQRQNLGHKTMRMQVEDICKGPRSYNSQHEACIYKYVLDLQDMHCGSNCVPSANNLLQRYSICNVKHAVRAPWPELQGWHVLTLLETQFRSEFACAKVEEDRQQVLSFRRWDLLAFCPSSNGNWIGCTASIRWRRAYRGGITYITRTLFFSRHSSSISCPFSKFRRKTFPDQCVSEPRWLNRNKGAFTCSVFSSWELLDCLDLCTPLLS